MYENPEPGVFEITGEVPELGCSFEVRYEEGTGPAGNDIIKVTPPAMYFTQLRGLCGDWNDDPVNDDQFCPGTPAGDISFECVDGEHQGNDSKG